MYPPSQVKRHNIPKRKTTKSTRPLMGHARYQIEVHHKSIQNPRDPTKAFKTQRLENSLVLPPQHLKMEIAKWSILSPSTSWKPKYDATHTQQLIFPFSKFIFFLLRWPFVIGLSKIFPNKIMSSSVFNALLKGGKP